MTTITNRFTHTHILDSHRRISYIVCGRRGENYNDFRAAWTLLFVMYEVWLSALFFFVCSQTIKQIGVYKSTIWEDGAFWCCIIKRLKHLLNITKLQIFTLISKVNWDVIYGQNSIENRVRKMCSIIATGVSYRFWLSKIHMVHIYRTF